VRGMHQEISETRRDAAKEEDALVEVELYRREKDEGQDLDLWRIDRRVTRATYERL